jgi:hypothetical protein
MMTAFNNNDKKNLPLMIKKILKRLCEENKSILDKERLKLKKISCYKVFIIFIIFKLSII